MCGTKSTRPSETHRLPHLLVRALLVEQVDISVIVLDSWPSAQPATIEFIPRPIVRVVSRSMAYAVSRSVAYEEDVRSTNDRRLAFAE